MQISCPYCGTRDLREFTYAGDASRKTPAIEADFDTWASYVWERGNPRGRHHEFWQHTHGCRQFMKVIRDTASHEIHDVAAIGSFAAAGDKEGDQ